MPKFTGKSINMSIQEAFEDAVRQALLTKAEEVHEVLTSVELKRVFAERHGEGSFRILFVEIDAK
ncbi:MAG: hypothetical protein ACR2IE_06960 [Candidatus Sumerlaeaceae bacterium]